MALLTIEDYLEEINSEQFKSGVEAALKHTQRTGRETGFNVDYADSFGFVYNIFIEVGTEYTLGISAHLELMDREAFSTYGRGYDELTYDEKDAITEELFNNPLKDVCLEHPNPEKRNLEDYAAKEYQIFDTREGLIRFHTHPYFESHAITTTHCNPSAVDLETHNHFRRQNEKEYNPISIIAAVNSKEQASFPVIMYQQRGDVQKYDFDDLALALMYKNELELALQEMQLDIKKKKEMDESMINIIGEVFNVIPEKYTIWRGQYTYGVGFDFGPK